MKKQLHIFLFFLFLLSLGSLTIAADPTTESNCNIGMVKGDQGRACEVPIPNGCSVANYPDYETPWIDISKGGNTKCQFDKNKTDWKTIITGSCGPCKTNKCSARFSVMFNCHTSIPFKEQPRKVH